MERRVELQNLVEAKIAEKKANYLQNEGVKQEHLYGRLKAVFEEYVAQAKQIFFSKTPDSIPVLVGKHFSYAFIDFYMSKGPVFGMDMGLVIANNPQEAKSGTPFYEEYGTLLEEMKVALGREYKRVENNADDYIVWLYEKETGEKLLAVLGWKGMRELKTDDDEKIVNEVLRKIVEKIRSGVGEKSRFVLSDEVKYGPVFQINRRTLLRDDYVNAYVRYRGGLSHYAEMKQFRPEKLPEVVANFLASIAEFSTYRDQYLKRCVSFVNKNFFGNEMTEVDEQEMVDQLFSMSPRAKAVDELSIAFKAELDTIKTAEDIPRFEEIYGRYLPRFQELFLS